MTRRVLFYSHDTVGLGHIRRTLALAKHLAANGGDLTALVIAGTPFIHAFRLPRNVDTIKLPSLRKVDNGCYEARNLRVEREELFSLREELIRRTFESFRPDLFIVDKVPAGVHGELLPTLRKNLARKRRTRLVLGLRDILDAPEEVIRSWTREGTYDVVERYYDKVIVWGMREIYDPIREYAFPPAIAEKVTFCGYIKRGYDECPPSLLLRPEGRRLVLATAGGGEDGLLLLKTFVQGLTHAGERFASVVLLGPDMPEAHRTQIRAYVGPGRRNVFILDYTSHMDRFLASASVVVSMGGYNSVCESVSSMKKLILVPRISPRTEQLIRARQMEGLGVARMIHPADLTPRRLAEEIDRALVSPDRPRADGLDFGGLDRAFRELASTLRIRVERDEDRAEMRQGAA